MSSVFRAQFVFRARPRAINRRRRRSIEKSQFQWGPKARNSFSALVASIRLTFYFTSSVVAVSMKNVKGPLKEPFGRSFDLARLQSRTDLTSTFAFFLFFALTHSVSRSLKFPSTWRDTHQLKFPRLSLLNNSFPLFFFSRLLLEFQFFILKAVSLVAVGCGFLFARPSPGRE